MNRQMLRMRYVWLWIWPVLPAAGCAVRLCAAVCLAVILFQGFCVFPVHADEYDSIIEKNLFHDQRQKWEMENSQSKGAAAKAGSVELQDIKQIKLFGTVIKDSHSYAVMRVAAEAKPGKRVSRRLPRGRKSPPQRVDDSQDTKRPYAVGDFIGGYRIVGIKPDRVLLQEAENENRYEIFMNDGQTERSVERTEVPEDKPEEPPKASGDQPPSRRSRPPRPSPNPAQAADFMRQRFEKDMQLLREDTNEAVAQQAERDWEKLQPMLPSLDEKRREDLMRLKEEFEKIRQR